MPRKKEDWFRAAYPDCLQPLRKYLRRFVGSAEAAEDLAHGAFLRVYNGPDFEARLKDQALSETWIYQWVPPPVAERQRMIGASGDPQAP